MNHNKNRFLIGVSGFMAVTMASSQALAASYAETVLADGPVAYYRLGDAAGSETATDELGNHPGIYTTPSLFGTPGALVQDSNTAAQFDGSTSRIEIPYSPDLNPGQFSFELWAKVLGGEGSFRSPLTSRDDPPQKGYILYAASNDTWQFWNGQASGGWQSVQGPPVVLNEWIYLVGTYDGTTKRLYANGELVGEAQVNIAFNEARPIRIGGGATESEAGNFFFNGEIDEVAIYNRALGQDEITAHYSAALFPDNTAPSFSSVPGSQSLPIGTQGASITFSANAVGTQPISYQWFFNGNEIENATGSSLTLANAGQDQVGDYVVRATNSAGEESTPPATFSLVAPGIQPANQTRLTGQSARFEVPVPSGAQLTYQWLINGEVIPGANSSILEIGAVSPSNAGLYNVVVTEGELALTSAESLLLVPEPPTQSYRDTILGDNPVAYYRLGEPVASSTLTDETGQFPGTYLVNVAFEEAGALLGDADTSVTFAGQNDSLAEIPYSAALNPSVFTIELWARPTGGAGGYRSPITSRDFFPAEEIFSSGYIFYAASNNRWEFWNGNGSSAWDVISGPGVVLNEWVHLVGTFDGTLKRFYVNGALVGEQELTSFLPNNFDFAPVRIGGGATEDSNGNFFFPGGIDEVAIYGQALTADQVARHYSAAFPPSSPPEIVNHPQGRVSLVGSSLSLGVSANSGSALSYQWRKDSVDIQGATQSSLVISPVSEGDAGSYDVVVTNAGGSVTSDPALITVPPFPTLSYKETILASNPVALWSLDESVADVTENGTAQDHFGNHPGMYLNGVTPGRPGIPNGGGTAAGFNGSAQKIDIPWSEMINPSQFTIEIWAKVTGGSSYRSPFTSRGDFPQSGFIIYADPNNVWQFWSGSGEQVGWNIASGAPVVANEWTHLAGTYDGTTMRFYVNGSLVGMRDAIYSPNPQNPLRLGGGATEGDGSFFFVGDLDEAAVYNQALDESTLFNHYVAGASVPPSSDISLTITSGAEGDLSVAWEGEGVLQEASGIGNPTQWSDVEGASNPYSVTPSESIRIFRVIRR